MSSFSFCFFLPVCFTFPGLRNCKGRDPSPRGGGCVWGVPALCSSYRMNSPTVFWLCVGISSPCPGGGGATAHEQELLQTAGVAELCTGCFPAKLPGEPGADPGTFIAVSSSFLDLGNAAKARGRESLYSNSCKDCDSFICSSKNALARWLRQICKLMTQKR